MKRSLSFFGSLATFGAALALAVPAYAQDLSSTGSDAAAGGVVIATWCCLGVFSLLGLALFILWVWMVVDAFGRQEYEFPNSSGNSKNLWIILLLVLGLLIQVWWVIGPIYYFIVFKKIKRGTVAPQWAGNAPAAPPAPPYMPPTPTYAPPAPSAPTYAPPVPPVSPPAPPAPPAPPTAPPAPPAPPTSEAPPSDPGQPPA
jgi:hypothetical protein